MEIRRETPLTIGGLSAGSKVELTVKEDSTEQQLVQGTKEQDEKVEKEYVFSKQLDEEAAGYKEGNATFKDDYESLEKAIDIVRALAMRLREKINKLKNPTVTIKSDHPVEGDSSIKLSASAKAYHDESTKSEVESLEQQLSEFERQEAEIKMRMLNMIIEERKRLERQN